MPLSTSVRGRTATAAEPPVGAGEDAHAPVEHAAGVVQVTTGDKYVASTTTAGRPR